MLITKARPAAPLALTTAPQIIADAGQPPSGQPLGPCFLTIPGSSELELSLLNITATGHVEPKQPGTLSLILYGLASSPNMPAPARSLAAWTVLAQTPPEPVGGASDPVTTQWMIQGTRLMYFLGSGKLQGEQLSNIAAHPIPAAILTDPLLGLLRNIDPVAYFAIGAYFTPNVPPIGTAPVCAMTSFTLGDGS